MWSVHTHRFNQQRPKQQQQYNLERLRFNRRGASTPLWGVQSCSPKAGGPTQSQLSRPMSSGHHISMEHRLRRKQLISDTDASCKTYLKEIQEQRQEETFLWRKNEKMKKNIKDKRKKRGKKRREKKGKEGPERYTPRRLKKNALLFFKKRNVTRNLEAIEAKKNGFRATLKDKSRKMKKNEENQK